MELGASDQEQEVEAVYFVKGPVDPNQGMVKPRIPIAEVDPIVMSETLRTVEAMMQEGL
jgi:hypothetical protein